MRIIRFLRLVCALCVFLIVCVPAAVHLYGAWAWCVLVRTPDPVRRRRAGNWRAVWSAFALGAVTPIIGMRIDVVARGGEAGRKRHGPCIVVSNHQSSLDIIILAATLARIGYRDTRWILKEQLRHRSFFIGHSCMMDGSAFVKRGGLHAESDRTAVVVGAERAGEDGAAFVIFPEGTRFSPMKRVEGFDRVLMPRKGGFSLALRHHAPEAHVLSVTLHWEGMAASRSWLASAAAVVGKRIRVEWELCDRSTIGEEWLMDEWRRKDARLEAFDAHSI